MEKQAAGKSTKKRESKFYCEPINQRIRLRMQVCKVRPTDLAEQLGVSMEAVRQWCAGYSQPSIKYIPLIAKALSCSCNYLLGATENVVEQNEHIGDRLGLSDYTINTLEYIKTNLTNAAKVQNELLQQRDYCIFLLYIDFMLQNIKLEVKGEGDKTSNLVDVARQRVLDDRLLQESDFSLKAISVKDYSKYLKYQVHDYLDAMLDKMINEVKYHAQEARE